MLASAAWGQVSPADAQEREIVAKLLASEKDSDKAWGAVLAANYRQARFVPEILELLKSPEVRVRLAALDALIRLDADPPEEVMAVLLDAHPEHFDAVLILMNGHILKNQQFLESLLLNGLVDGGTHGWAVLNAVLSQRWSPVQARHLWDTWSLHVRVLDPTASVSRGGLCADYGPRAPRESTEFPPRLFYQVYEPLPGSLRNALVSSGPHPVSIGNDCQLLPDRAQHTRDYLEYFAGPGAPIANTILRWSSAATFRKDAGALMPHLRAYIKDLRVRLIAKGLLTADAAMWPKIEVSDERKDKSAPLPEFEWTLE